MTDEVVTCIIGMIFGALVGGLICAGIMDTAWQNDLIQQNRAEWTIDSKTGVRQFKYKDCCNAD